MFFFNMTYQNMPFHAVSWHACNKCKHVYHSNAKRISPRYVTSVAQIYDLNRRDEYSKHYPDSKVHGANMGPIWSRQDPGGPHVGPTNLAIWVHNISQIHSISKSVRNVEYIYDLYVSVVPLSVF